jgi:hypothetical protein
MVCFALYVVGTWFGPSARRDFVMEFRLKAGEFERMRLPSGKKGKLLAKENTTSQRIRSISYVP